MLEGSEMKSGFSNPPEKSSLSREESRAGTKVVFAQENNDVIKMNSNNLNDYSDLIVNFSHNLNNFCDLLVNFPQLNDRPTKDLRNLLVTSINITY